MSERLLRVTYLGLHESIPQKDVRKLIYGKLNKYDREMVLCAHNSTRAPKHYRAFAYHCAENGYLELLKWANN